MALGEEILGGNEVMNPERGTPMLQLVLLEEEEETSELHFYMHVHPGKVMSGHMRSWSSASQEAGLYQNPTMVLAP